MTPLDVIRVELDDESIELEESMDRVDSLEFIEMVHRLEQKFDVRIEPEDLEPVATFGELASLVDRKRNDTAILPG